MATTSPIPQDWYRTLPKIELHAHLSGSVPHSTLIRLITHHATTHHHTHPHLHTAALADIRHHALQSQHRDLSQCFEVFALLHKYINTLDILHQVTQDVIRACAADEIIYLELRTTPRTFITTPQPADAPPAAGGGGEGGRGGRQWCTKQQHIDTVIDAIRACQGVRTPGGRQIVVRLLLSIDRTQSVANAIENVQLASHYMHDGTTAAAAAAQGIVVGIDFSGNPTKSTFTDFRPAFDLATQLHIPCAIHCGEVDNHADTEAILQYENVGRLGHAVCMTEQQFEQVYQRQIPIEICTTSNLMTACVHHIHAHPVYELIKRQARYTVCTDDSGVFGSDLSSEYWNVYQHTKLSKKHIAQLAANSVDQIFDTVPATKQQLKQYYADFISQLE